MGSPAGRGEEPPDRLDDRPGAERGSAASKANPRTGVAERVPEGRGRRVALGVP